MEPKTKDNLTDLAEVVSAPQNNPGLADNQVVSNDGEVVDLGVNYGNIHTK